MAAPMAAMTVARMVVTRVLKKAVSKGNETADSMAVAKVALKVHTTAARTVGTMAVRKAA